MSREACIFSEVISDIIVLCIKLINYGYTQDNSI